jgi:hypothetical protein
MVDSSAAYSEFTAIRRLGNKGESAGQPEAS